MKNVGNKILNRMDITSQNNCTLKEHQEKIFEQSIIKTILDNKKIPGV